MEIINHTKKLAEAKAAIFLDTTKDEREREMEKQSTKSHGRVELVPTPLQGHITPLLQLGTILHSKGFSITVAHAEFNSPNPSNLPEFVFQPLSDNTSEHDRRNPYDFIVAINNNC